ncbi:MAG: 1-phosphofructokinase [Clostridium sp.]|nr:1-phosphofructokinase [Clostridium sp.]
MIITITLNPAIDKTIELLDFRPGQVNRIQKARQDIGGKGINVSKALGSLDLTSTALGFLGGVYKEEFKEKLKQYNIKDFLTLIEDETRVNIKIVDLESKEVTDINDLGPTISETEINNFLMKFENKVRKEDIVVISGSLPRGIDIDFYKILISKAKASGAFIIFDADGSALREGLKAEPHIIKPNIHELEGLAGMKLKSDYEIIKCCKEIIKTGVEKIIVSLGEKGSILVDKDKAYKVSGQKVEVKSTVGAGDSMVAAIAYGLNKGLDDKEILCLAQAMGVASVKREGTRAPKSTHIKNQLKIARKNIKEIKYDEFIKNGYE